jgi:putative ABC transport system permease protein
MAGIGHDLRFAVRLLGQQPGFTAVALLTLALGVGVTTAIFSVVNAVILRPLPFEHSERLVVIFENNVQRGWMAFSVAPANFVDWTQQSRTFQSIAAFSAGTAALITSDVAQQVPATSATSELFTVLRGTALFGRTFVQGDDLPGAPPVAVIGHGLWQRRFGAAPSVVGTVVTINDRPTTIVGVMPQGFGRGNPDTDVWLPLTIDRARAERGGRVLGVLGRLADNVTLDQARTEMQGIAERMAGAYPGSNAGWGTTLVPLEDAVVGRNVRRALLLLLGAVAFVLLIACVNVANLLAARGITRQRELAIRAALGAGRLRLIRQLLTESVVLAAIGGAMGIFVAVWGTKLLLALAPPSLPRLHEVDIDLRVLMAGLGATLVAALIFGLMPALQAITARPDHALKDTSRGASAGPLKRRLSHGFVVAEIGLTVVLLVGAGLLVRSFVRLSNQSLGFEPDRTVAFALTLPESRYPTPASVSQFHRSLLDRIRQLPGVTAVGATHALPFTGMGSVRPFVREGETVSADAAPTSQYRLITPGYFAAMGIPVTRGREFTDSDTFGQPGVAIVSESFARRFLRPDPIGQRIKQAGGGDDVPWLTVVGVVGDVRHFGLTSDLEPEMFWPEAQATWGATLNRLRRGLTVVVRAADDPLALLPAIRTQVAAIDPRRPMIDARPIGDLVARSADVQRFSMVLLANFAAIGLALAAAGVYGVMSYTVAARRREMGIRLALGARPRVLLAGVLRTGLGLAAAGAAVGFVASWMLGSVGVFETLLFQTPPRDVSTFLAVAGVLFGTAAFACYRPAQRAARVDPIEALREE